MKKHTLLGTATIAISLGIWGCEKTITPAIENEPVTTVELKVQHGALAFASSEEFAKTMAYFNAIGEDKAREIVSGLPNFKSLVEITPNDKADIERLNKALWQQQAAIQLSNYDPAIDDVAPPEPLVYDDYLIQDPIMELCLNTYREIIIGSHFIRVTEHGVFAYTPEQRSNFEIQFGTSTFETALQNYYTSSSQNDLQYLPQVTDNIYLVNRDRDLFSTATIQQFSTACNGTQLQTNIFGQLTDCNIDIDNRRRYRATVWAQNTGVYSSIGMKTRRQTRFLRVWWNTEGERLSVEGVGEYYTKWPNNVPIYYTYTRSGTLIDRTNQRKVSSELPQPWHTGEFGWSSKGPKFKPAKKYEFKKHESDHYGWINGVRHHRKIKHN